MLTDRRPILLANARVIDPSRDFDGPGDLLIADGIVRDLRRGIERMGVEVARDMREGLNGADIVMMLRLQRERMNGSFVPSSGEYFHYFGLDQKKLAYAKPDALVMHPGPMNRGVEIDSAVADGARSVILPQVTFGIAVRMAVMSIIAGN